MTRLAGLVLLSLLVGVGTVVPGSAPERGSVTVAPEVGMAGNYGTWTVTWRVGRDGVATGGGIRVQLPDTWHAGDRNSANRLQALDPRADHYVSARVSRSDVRLETRVESQPDSYLVKSARPSLDGRLERYVIVVRVTVAEGRLRPGDTVDVVYGDRSGGSRGMRAAITTTEAEPVLSAVDPEGSGRFELLPDGPTLTAVSGPAAELLLVVPSQAVVGTPTTVHLAVVDRDANPVADYRGEVELRLLQGEAVLPDTGEMEGAWTRFELTPSGAGVIRLQASSLGRILLARSNPMKVTEHETDRRILWGDLHSHSHYSWDGVGRDPFQYARRVSALDFYAMTDHSRSRQDGMPRGLGPHVWNEYTAQVEAHNDPPAFVTLHAYEISLGAPWGHHNVYFRDDPGALVAAEGTGLPELWQQLEAGRALTIPHHTGKFPSPVRWDVHDPERRRNFEIYSAHGLSEVHDPAHPLAFEQSDFTSPSRSVDGPQFAQHAWMAGLRLSTIAASDDHRSQPGKPHWGLAAVSATGSTRQEVFDALYERRTYGTTGARILLEFQIGGVDMGQAVSVKESPRLTIEAHGTDVIERIEVLRHSGTDGGFETAFTIEPEALDVTWSRVDSSFREDSIYYVRLLQRGRVRGRVAMAWSSPIWVSKLPQRTPTPPEGSRPGAGE